MSSLSDTGSVLGKQVEPIPPYSPSILHPIVRGESRRTLPVPLASLQLGGDVWHAYELSWLDMQCKPQVWVGRFYIPASSPNTVESKSFKLYLNSLNREQFANEQAARAQILADLAYVIGSDLKLELFAVDDPALRGESLCGVCLDTLTPPSMPSEPDANGLQVRSAQIVSEQVYSHLLRTLCPVTEQPDWASVFIRYTGAAIEHGALLSYFLSFREHREFHEASVERIFADLLQQCAPTALTVQACYTRRGGLDISPMRSTEADAQPLPRLIRQ